MCIRDRNDTGPAHICAHLNKKGVVLFGSHTTPEKVSMESQNFKSLRADDLKNLNVADVYEKIKENFSQLFLPILLGPLKILLREMTNLLQQLHLSFQLKSII